MKGFPENVQPSTGTVVANGKAYGKNKGYQTKRIVSKQKHVAALRQNKTQDQLTHSDRFVMAKQIAKEICGYAPYEKKAMDLARMGKDKKMRKFLKKRLGSLRMAKRRQDTLTLAAKQLNK